MSSAGIARLPEPTQGDVGPRQDPAPPPRVLASLRRHPGLVIFVVALALRLAWVLTLDERLAWPDEETFTEIGRHLAQGDGYVSTSFRANPVLPVFLGAFFAVFGDGYLAPRIGQAVLGALTCVLLWRVGSTVAGGTAGALAGLMLTAYVPHIYLAGVFYVDCLLTFLCALGVYLAVLSMQAPRPLPLAILCGVVLGVTALARPIFAVYVPCLAAAWVYAARDERRRWIPIGLALCLASAATVLPWTIRNYAVHGRLIPISAGFFTKLWEGNNVLALGGAEDRDFRWGRPEWEWRLARLPEDERRAVARRYAEVDRRVRAAEAETGDRDLATDIVLRPVALAEMAAHPGRIVRLFGRKLVTLFSAFTRTMTTNDFTSRRNQLLAAAAFYPVLVLSLVGAVVGLANRRALAPVYALLVSVTFAYGLLIVCTRFRLALDPYLILFAALALARAWQWWRGAPRLAGRCA